MSLGNKLFRCQIKTLNLKEFDFGVQANSLVLDIDSEATDNLPNHFEIYTTEVNRSLARAFFEDENFAIIQPKKVITEIRTTGRLGGVSRTQLYTKANSLRNHPMRALAHPIG